MGHVFRTFLCRKKNRSRSSTDPIYSALKECIRSGAQWIDTQAFADVCIYSKDNLRLHGRLLDLGAQTTVILVHGYHSGSHARGFDAERYTERNFNILLIDHRAHGQSEGKYIGMGYLEKTDLLLWIDFVRARFNGKIILDGVSMGATTCLMAGSENPPGVAAIISDCAYSSALEIFSYELNQRHIPSFPALNIVQLQTRLISGYDLRDADALLSISRCKIPVLFLHGLSDDFVPPYMADRLFAAAECRKDIYLVDGAVHGAARAIDPENCFLRIDAFLRSATNIS